MLSDEASPHLARVVAEVRAVGQRRGSEEAMPAGGTAGVSHLNQPERERARRGGGGGVSAGRSTLKWEAPLLRPRRHSAHDERLLQGAHVQQPRQDSGAQ